MHREKLIDLIDQLISLNRREAALSKLTSNAKFSDGEVNLVLEELGHILNDINNNRELIILDLIKIFELGPSNPRLVEKLSSLKKGPI